MARIKSLPSIETIRGFRGILDFYVWRGLPCVRRWPNKGHHNRSPVEVAAGYTFGAIIKAFALVGGEVKALYDQDAVGQPRTGRDIYVSALFGKLHEVNMSDFLDLLTECRDLLLTLTDINNALGSVDTDDLQVDVKSSALPALAATAAHQVTQNTALHKLDDLQDALQSVNTDALQVRGRDQLHSFNTILASTRAAAISGTDGWVDSASPGAGALWIVTHVAATDATSATTRHRHFFRHLTINFDLKDQSDAFPAGTYSFDRPLLWLAEGDTVRVYFTGGLVDDQCTVRLLGHTMTLET